MIKFLHTASSYLPRLGGVPMSIRDFAHNVPGEHTLIVRSAFRTGRSLERAPAGWDVSDPFLRVLRIDTAGDQTWDHVCAAHARDMDYDIFMAHGVLKTRPWENCRCGARSVVYIHNMYEQSLLEGSKAVLVTISPVFMCPGHHPQAVISQFVDTNIFKPAPAHRDGFLYVGRIAPEKRLPELVRALPAGEELRIVGECDHPVRDAGPLSEAISLTRGHVTLVGTLPPEGVALEMQRARALVSASRSETFGQVFAQALACGTPVRTTALGACRAAFPEGVSFTSSIEGLYTCKDVPPVLPPSLTWATGLSQWREFFARLGYTL